MKIKRILAVAVSAGLLAWLLADGRWRGIGEVFRRLDGLTLGLAFAGFLASYLLRALRVFDEFRAQAAGRFGTCLRIVLVHNAMINVVPFRGGEAAFPILLRQSFGVALPRAIASLFWFRLQDAFVVMALAAIVVALATLLLGTARAPSSAATVDFAPTERHARVARLLPERLLERQQRGGIIFALHGGFRLALGCCWRRGRRLRPHSTAAAQYTNDQ